MSISAFFAALYCIVAALAGAFFGVWLATIWP